MKHIYVEETESGREIALTDNGRLTHFEREEKGGVHPEQIYLCKVERLMPGLEAAFVRLDDKNTGFLPFDACRAKPKGGEMRIVQVRRGPVGEKQAMVSEDITLPGRLLILTPETPKAAVSGKITDREKRAAMKALAQKLLPEGMGAVMRTESVRADESELRAEADALVKKWMAVKADAARNAACRLLMERESALDRLLRNVHGQIAPIVSNVPLSGLDLPVRVQHDPFQLENVRAQWKKAHDRKVYLDCGGYLVIDRTEALTVIDVNSGKYIGQKSGAEGAFARLNREAAEEAARLMRLRSMGGIILIDFVDMREEKHREEILSLLREKCADDPMKVTLYGFTALGLMELARKRTEEEHG